MVPSLREMTGRTNTSQSQSYVTTDGQSASLSSCQAPIWNLKPNSFFCLTVAYFAVVVY
jgi:hypothetical protein